MGSANIQITAIALGLVCFCCAPLKGQLKVCVPSLPVITLLPCRAPLPLQSQSVWLRDFEYKTEEVLE